VSQSSGSSPSGSTHTGLLITLTIIAALGDYVGYDSPDLRRDRCDQAEFRRAEARRRARLSLEGFTIAERCVAPSAARSVVS
jgi:hypothetical protein